MFLSERYLSILRPDQALLFLKFRTLNNNLPVQKERFVNTSRAERVCTKCNMGEVGDEYHYIFICNFFKDKRESLLPSYYWRKPNVLKYQQLFNITNRRLLIKLLKLIQVICKGVLS